MFKLLLRKVDQQTGCYYDDAIIEQDGLESTERLLNKSGLAAGDVLELNSIQYAKIVESYQLNVDQVASTGELRIYPHRQAIDLNSHTGRELKLMIEGKKPFAAFAEIYPDDCHLQLIPEENFATYCKSGKILKYEYFQQIEVRKTMKIVRRVLYALPGEEWRFKAHQMIWNLANKHGWNSFFETIEGFLLGYETNVDPFFGIPPIYPERSNL
ncbi:MAG: hypothetical protein KGO53_12655 [Alphaproteobacteria bacterium]|nr:hypothetical protein [Alphaproteobacteria bacterium]